MPSPAPPVPTLGQLHAETTWVWAYCTSGTCHHDRPIALAPWVIRWGPDASSDRLRQTLVCARCGHRGAMLMHPSVDVRIGIAQTWPVSYGQP